MKRILIFSLITLFFFCSACSDELGSDGEIVEVRYGTAFGECIGYCLQNLTIDESSIAYTKSGWVDSIRAVTCSEDLSVDVWRSLTNSIDMQGFYELPETIGCPDCADGGAEWLMIEAASGRIHKVTFEYHGAPATLDNILLFLRQQLEQADNCGLF